MVRLFDAGLFLSSEEQKEWQQFYPEGQFFVVSNPFIPAVLEHKPCNKVIDSKKIPIFLFVGRLIREKGIYDLIEAASLLKPVMKFKMVIVGAGVEETAIKLKIVDADLENEVILTGYLHGEELVNTYEQADIFILPTFWKEGFPTVIAEAMSFGLPIITTTIRGNNDHLKEGKNALFIPPKDSAALILAIKKLVDDEELYSRISNANLEKVKCFAPMEVAEKYLFILDQLCN